MGKNNEGVIHLLPLLLVGVLIVGVGVAMYWYGKNSGKPIITKASPSPEAMEPKTSPDPTVNWKTYTYTNYNFSFEYPSDWEVRDLLPANKDLPGKDQTVLMIGYGPKDVKEDVAGIIEITTRTMAEEMTLYKQSLQQNPVVDFVVENPLKISGIDGREVVHKNNVNNIEFKAWFINKNGYTYRFSGGSSDNPTINEVAKTIKITQ